MTEFPKEWLEKIKKDLIKRPDEDWELGWNCGYRDGCTEWAKRCLILKEALERCTSYCYTSDGNAGKEVLAAFEESLK